MSKLVSEKTLKQKSIADEQSLICDTDIEEFSIAFISVDRKLDWKAESKIPKATDAKHKAGGGNVEIIDRKLEWKAEAKIPKATEASKHKPGGGNVEIGELY